MKFSRRINIVGLSAILLLAAALRMTAMRGQLWLDEAWSALIARACHSPMDILMSADARVDNNHPLNTLWMYLLGMKAHWAIYRIPSVLSGIGIVWLAWKIARGERLPKPTAPPWDVRSKYLTPLLPPLAVAISYPLVLYSSEARGYASAIFFSLLCFDLLHRGVSRGKHLVLYWLCAILGLLAHLTFIQFLLAAMVYTFVYSKRNVREVVRVHAVPVAATTILYFVFIRHLHIAGGPASSAAEVLSETAALFVGGSSIWAALIFALLLVILIIRLARRRDPLLGFVAALVVAPFAVLAVKTAALGHAEILYVRYFLIPATFILIFGTLELSRMAEESPQGFLLAAAYAIYFLSANGYQLAHFLRAGRGEPLSAFRYIIGSRTDAVIYVTTLWPEEPGQHDFRARRLLDFYDPYLPQRPKIVLMRPTTSAAEWLLVSSASGNATPAIQFIGNTYLLQKVFPHYGLSGWTWCAYRRADMMR